MKRLNKKDFKLEEAKNERDIMIKIKSPFVINIKEAFQDIEHIYLVSEYAPGGDLGFHWNEMKSFS